MTVPTVTAPPVPACLVMTEVPSEAISAMGNPGVTGSAISPRLKKA